MGEHTWRRPRDTSRLVLEILVWLLAFSLLLCIPADRSTSGRPAEHARVAESR